MKCCARIQAGPVKEEKTKKKAYVDCLKCIHFYVTWDKRFPRGCRAYGFKTVNLPSADVYNSSGIPCARFKRRLKDTV